MTRSALISCLMLPFVFSASIGNGLAQDLPASTESMSLLSGSGYVHRRLDKTIYVSSEALADRNDDASYPENLTIALDSSVPAANASGISKDTTIALTFDSAPDIASFTPTNAVIRGQQSGPIAGSWSASGNVATFTPSNDLVDGEVIHVELSTGIAGTNGGSLATREAFSFTVQPSAQLAGESWIGTTPAAAQQWRSVTYGEGRFVAVSGSGTQRLMYSDDGKSWTPVTVPATNNWFSVTYGNGRFVAVAFDGSNQAIYSDDGITWDTGITVPTGSWRSVIYGKGRFVAVSNTMASAVGQVMYSDNGVNWTAASSSELKAWSSITYGNGRFVATAFESAGYPSGVMYSDDGINWTTTSNHPVSDWFTVTYGNGRFAAISRDTSQTTQAMYSTNGIDWVAANPVEKSSWFNLNYGNGRFVAVANSGTKRVMYSTDGDTWNPTDASEAASWYSVAYGGGKFVAVAFSGQAMLSVPDFGFDQNPSIPVANATGVAKDTTIALTFDSAPDMTSFTSTNAVIRGQQSGPIAGSWSASGNVATFTPSNDLVDGEVIHVELSTAIAGTNGGSLATREAFSFTVAAAPPLLGDNWVSVNDTDANSSNWASIAYGEGRYVAVANSGVNRIMYSDDGTSWIAIPAPVNSYWRSITYGGGRFVAVAGDGVTGTNRIMHSVDGVSWTSISAPQDNDWFSVAYGNGRFVAVSRNGTSRVMYSDDGNTWTTVVVPTNNWSSVTYGNGRFVAVSADGTNRVMYSNDGVTWASASAASVAAWLSVTYGNGLYVAVSTTKAVMYSTNGVNWTSVEGTGDHYWDVIGYGNGRFVSIGRFNLGQVMYSDDGLTWQGANLSESHGSKGLVFGDGKFVAVSDTGTNRVMITQPAFNLSSSTPLANATGIAKNTTIALTFDSAPDSASFTPTNAVIRGQQSGPIAGSWGVSGNVATFTPSNDLVDGEVIHVELNTSIAGTNGGSLATKKAFSFTVAAAEPLLGDNWVSAALADSSQALDVVYGEGRYVAVSYNGTNPMYSDDGKTWVSGSGAEGNQYWWSVTYGNGRFVAVATTNSATNKVMYSDDGAIWNIATAAEDNYWEAVTFGNGRFVAVSRSGTNRVMYSDDGETWIAAAASEDNAWSGITYGNGRFVAVSTSGTNRVMYSDDGASWNSASATEASNWFGITYGNGRFVAVAQEGTRRAMYSPDGINWTYVNTPEQNFWRDVAYGNGRFVAVARSGTNRVMYSDDGGATWTKGAATEPNQWYSITYGDGRFVAIAGDGTNRVMIAQPAFNLSLSTPLANATGIAKNTTIALTFDSAPDSASFTPTNAVIRGQQSGPIAGSWSVSGNVATFTPSNDLVDGEVIHVELNTSIAGTNGGSLATKKAFSFTVAAAPPLLGDNWVSASGSQTGNWRGITYGEGRFVAVDTSNSFLPIQVMYSDDAQTWEYGTATAGSRWISVAHGEGRFVSVAQSSSNNVMYSDDGVSWQAGTDAPASLFQSVTYGNGRFVAVAYSGSSSERVMYSDDGIKWSTATNVASTARWFSVTYGNGRFVAVTDGGGLAMYSDDGITWTQVNSIGSNWQSVTYGNGYFVAVADGGTQRVMYSDDGATWVGVTLSENNQWRAVTYGNGRFVATAADGTNRIMYSSDGVNWNYQQATGDLSWLAITYGGGRFVSPSTTGPVMIAQPGFKLSSSVPGANATSITKDSNIALTFDSAPDITSFTSANAIIRGQQSGPIAGSWSVSGNVATFTPSNDLVDGEVIHVELNTNIAGTNGGSLATKEAFSFTVDDTAPSVLDSWVGLSAGAVETNEWRSVTYGEGLYVAVASSGTNRVMYSSNGQNWTPVVVPESVWFSIAYGNGRFVAVAQSGTTQAMYSEDGITWTSASVPEANAWRSVTYGNGRFVALSRDGTNRVMYSDDGATWISAVATEDNAWESVTYGNGRYVAVARTGTNRVMYSTDGATWTPAVAAEANSWYGVTYGNGKFVAVASILNSPTGAKLVMYSSDGVTWAAASATKNDYQWLSVTYGNGYYVALAYEGSGIDRVMYSVDAQIWTPANATEQSWWRGVVYGDEKFVAVSADGTNRAMISQPTFTFLSSAPADSDVGVSPRANIELTFNAEPDITTFTTVNAAVVGQNSGVIPGSWSVSGNTATFNPSNDLPSADIIDVTLNTALLGTSGVGLTAAETISFTVAEIGAGNLTIVASGGVAEDTGWIYNNGVLSAISSAVSVDASDVLAKLDLGALTIEATNITTSAEVTTTSANNLVLKATNNVVLNHGHTINTNGGDVVFWSDSDADGVGGIRVGSDTAGVFTTAITSNGGNIVLSGGADPLTGSAGFDSSLGAANSAYYYSVGVFGATVDARSSGSAGGNIIISGNSGNTFNGVVWTTQLGGQYGANTFVRTKGTGSIQVLGDGSQAPANANATNSRNSWAVVSSGTLETELGDIALVGSANVARSNARGFALSGSIQSTSGAIFIHDQTANTDSGNYTGPFINGLSLGQGALSTSSSDISLLADKFAFATNPTFETSGTVSIAPASESFEGAFTLSGLTLGSAVSGLTLGKAGNTSGITVGSATTVAGPITVFSDAIAVNAALEATNDRISFIGAAADDVKGTLTNTAAGTITADELLIKNIHQAQLHNHSNVSVGTVASEGGHRLLLTNDGALTIGSVDGVDGITATESVAVETTTGDLTVTEPVTSTLSSGTAITLNAGKAKGVDDDTGGDIIVSGNGAITIESGAVAKLYSGSPANSTGLSPEADEALVFYDETNEPPAASFAAGNVYAIYRKTTASQLSIQTQPATTIASGVAFATQPEVSITDAYGNVIHTDTTSKIKAEIFSGENGTLLGTQELTVTNGVATFSDLALRGPVGSTYRLRFTSLGLFAVASDNITITGPGPVDLAVSTITADPVGNLTADGTETSVLAVTVTDTYGNPIPGQSVVLTLNDDAGRTLGTETGTTNAIGQISTTLASTVSGVTTVNAYLNSEAQANLMGTVGVGFLAGAPAKLQMIGGNGQTGEVAQALANPLTVRVRDAQDNIVEGASVVFAGDGTTTPSTGVAVSDATGLATINWTLGETAGNQTLTATLAGTDPAVTVSFVATAEPGPPAQFAVVPASPKQLTTIPFALEVVLQDAYGNTTVADSNLTLALTDTNTSFVASLPGANDGDLEIDQTPGAISQTLTAGQNTIALPAVVYSGLSAPDVETPDIELIATATLNSQTLTGKGLISARDIKLSMVTSAMELTADGAESALLTTTLLDLQGAPVPNQPIRFEHTAGVLIDATTLQPIPSPVVLRGDANGTVEVRLRSSTFVESARVTALSRGADPISRDIAFKAGPPAKFVFTNLDDGTQLGPQLRSLPFGFKVAWLDAFDNPTTASGTGMTVTLAARTLNAGQGGAESGELRWANQTPSTPVQVAIPNDVASVTVGDVLYTGLSASLSGQDIVLTATGSGGELDGLSNDSQGFSVRDIEMTIEAAASSLVADGASNTEIVVTLTDANQVPQVGQNITAETSLGTLLVNGTALNNPLVTDANGQVRFTLQTGTVAGQAVVTARCPGACPVTTTVEFIGDVEGLIEELTDPDNSPNPQTYEDTGITGVDDDNIDIINELIDGLPEAQTTTTQQIQSSIDALNELLDKADGSPSTAPNLTAAGYQALGLSDIAQASSACISLTNSVMGSQDNITSFAQVQELAVIVHRACQTLNAQRPTPRLTVSDFEKMGIVGVDYANLSAVLTTMALADESTITSVAALQALIDGVPAPLPVPAGSIWSIVLLLSMIWWVAINQPSLFRP